MHEGHTAMFGLIKAAAARGVKTAGDILSSAIDDDIRRELAAVTADRSLFDEEQAPVIFRDCLRLIRRKPALEREALEGMIDPAKSGSNDAFDLAQKKYFELRKKRLE